MYIVTYNSHVIFSVTYNLHVIFSVTYNLHVIFSVTYNLHVIFSVTYVVSDPLSLVAVILYVVVFRQLALFINRLVTVLRGLCACITCPVVWSVHVTLGDGFPCN